MFTRTWKHSPRVRNEAWSLSLAVACLGLTTHAQETTTRLELGVATGEPGEIVAVPLRSTAATPIHRAQVNLAYDAARLQLVEFEPNASILPTHAFFVESNTFEAGEVTAAFFARVPPCAACQVPLGTHRLGDFRFRIRAGAATGVAPVELRRSLEATAGPTTFSYKGQSIPVDRLAHGGVTVNPPRGPRPVGELRCEQLVDEVFLRFTPTESYDAVEILRGGKLRANLEGNAEMFIDSVTEPGRYVYLVSALRQGVASFPVECVVDVTVIAPPPVGDLRCDERGIAWENPVAYDHIDVYQGDAFLTRLSGTEERFDLEDMTTTIDGFTLISELRGFPSAPTTCVPQGLWMFEVDDVVVPVNATTIEVPIYATTPQSYLGFSVGLNLDLKNSPLTLIEDARRSLAGSVVHPKADFVQVTGYYGWPLLAVLPDLLGRRDSEKLLRPGLRQHVGSFYFSVQPGAFSDGDRMPISLISRYFSLTPSLFTNTDGRTVLPDVVAAGEIRFGTPPARALAELQAESYRDSHGKAFVELSWRPTGFYDLLQVARNGRLVATLPGSTTGYRETAQGVLLYKIVGVTRDGSSRPETILVNTTTIRGAFRRGDANGDAVVDLADIVATLERLFHGRDQIPCDDAADANDDGRVDIEDVLFTLTHLYEGGGAFPSPGVFHAWFDPTPDGLDC